MKSGELQTQLSKRAATIKKLAEEMINMTRNEVESGRMDTPILRCANSIFDNAIAIENESKKLK